MDYVIDIERLNVVYNDFSTNNKKLNEKRDAFGNSYLASNQNNIIREMYSNVYSKVCKIGDASTSMDSALGSYLDSISSLEDRLAKHEEVKKMSNKFEPVVDESAINNRANLRELGRIRIPVERMRTNNCVSYCYDRVSYELGLDSLFVPGSGGKDWYGYFTNNHDVYNFPTTTNPAELRSGDVLCLNSYGTTAGRQYGHVAYVESVNPDGSITISEGGSTRGYNKQTYANLNAYYSASATSLIGIIHFK